MVLFCTYTKLKETSSILIANLGGGHRGYGKVDTHWELNPTRRIFIPHQILLYHGPIYEVLLVLQLM